jgi:hypothetical protein
MWAGRSQFGGRRVGFTSRVSIRCGFTALCLPKACQSRMASAIPPSRPQTLLTLPIVRAFAAHAATTPSADFCRAVRTPLDVLSHDSVTHSRSPAISSTAVHARPPDLPPVPLMEMGFPIVCSLARHRRPLHPVLVHRPACLLYASSGPHLTGTPLRFATLHLHQVGRGLSPPSCRTCTAYKQRARPKPRPVKDHKFTSGSAFSPRRSAAEPQVE